MTSRAFRGIAPVALALACATLAIMVEKDERLRDKVVDVDAELRSIPIQDGWAKNSVNAVIFRRNSVVSHDGDQYVAFYDADRSVAPGRRDGADPVQLFRERVSDNPRYSSLRR